VLLHTGMAFEFIYRGGTLTRHGMLHFGSCSFFIILIVIKNIILRITRNLPKLRGFGVLDQIELRTQPETNTQCIGGASEHIAVRSAESATARGDYKATRKET